MLLFSDKNLSLYVPAFILHAVFVDVTATEFPHGFYCRVWALALFIILFKKEIRFYKKFKIIIIKSQ